MKKYIILTCLVLCGCVQTHSANSYPQAQNAQQVYQDSMCNPDETLGGKLFEPSKIVSEFKHIPVVNDISEFETAYDFDTRIETTFNRYSSSYYLAYTKEDGFNEIKYDPYLRKFKFTVKNYPTPVYSKWASQEQYPTCFLLESAYKKKGTYVGANAFGATAIVSSSEHFHTVLYISNRTHIKRFNGVNSVQSTIFDISGYTKEIEPLQAEKIKGDLAIVYRVTPAPHYVGDRKYGVIDKTKKAEAPTISSPYASMQYFNVLFVNLKNVYVVNLKTLDVIGGACF